MKKLLCIFLMLTLLTSAALAEGHVIAGTVTSNEGESELNIQWGTDGFAIEREKGVLAGRWQANGALLLTLSDEISVLLPALPKIEGFSEKLTALLQDAPVYESARHSSLYIFAQQVELSGDAVCAFGLSLLDSIPEAAALAPLRQLLAQGGGSEPWATITRYLPDQRQYPNDQLLMFSLFAPGLPYIWLEIRTDEYGVNFRLAATQETVTDWDETILALEENNGESGLLLKGFTLEMADDEENNIYVEAELFAKGMDLHFETDVYISLDGAYDWYADAVLTDARSNEELYTLNLESELVDEIMLPEIIDTEVIDLTDGIDETEQALLAEFF